MLRGAEFGECSVWLQNHLHNGAWSSESVPPRWTGTHSQGRIKSLYTFYYLKQTSYKSEITFYEKP